MTIVTWHRPSMQRKSFARVECPIARALDEVGDAWSLLVLRNAFLGIRRFQDFQTRLEIAPTTLTRKLASLVELGLLERIPYEERPPREEYALTPKGTDLLPVLLSLAAWGNRWLAPSGAPLEMIDPETEDVIEPVVVDRRTGKAVCAKHVALRPGPGASAKLRRAMRTPIVLGAS